MNKQSHKEITQDRDIFLSLDLEMNQPSGKIIQIGACVGNLRTGEVLETYSKLVKIDEPLNPFIVKLCDITDEQLSSEGVSLVDAYQGLIELAKRHQVFCNPMTWGGGDSLELRQQLGPTPDWPFGRRWLDIKTLFQFRQFSRAEKMQAGLAKALTRVKLKFQGTKHNAKDDAVNTFLLAHYLTREQNGLQ